jgi:hypothetical protein
MSAEFIHPSSGDDPFEAFEGFLDGQELSEDLDLKALLETLHFYHERAQAVDEDAQATKDKLLGELAVKMGKGRFVKSDSDPRIANCVYDEMIWQPRAGTATAFTVSAVMVRYPRLSGDEYGLPTEAEVVPNDILVEVHTKTGNAQRYVMNGKDGIVGYPDGEALDFDRDELRRWWESDKKLDRPNVIGVRVEDWQAEPLSVGVLREMLIDDSTFNELPDEQ